MELPHRPVDLYGTHKGAHLSVKLLTMMHKLKLFSGDTWLSINVHVPRGFLFGIETYPDPYRYHGRRTE